MIIQYSVMEKNRLHIEYPIPVIDIFAGPGGLGEGFCSVPNPQTGKPLFKIALSIEMDEYAHKTLTLRSFYRQFAYSGKPVPEDYYRFLRQEITIEELYQLHPEKYEEARTEAWKARLGNGEGSVPNEEVDKRITDALKGRKDFILIGGPPCQAYSLVGRSRRKQVILNEETDERVGLYKQYLRILAVHNPAVFVMENVKGMLSAKTEESPVFEKILNDLADPVKAFHTIFRQNGTPLTCPGYEIYSLVKQNVSKHTDYLIRAEEYGIPQARHRVILLGIRNDILAKPEILRTADPVTVSQAIADLPKIRSGLSKIKDTDENWKQNISKLLVNGHLNDVDKEIRAEIINQVQLLEAPETKTGKIYIKGNGNKSNYETDWYSDPNLKGICNHESRGHMQTDLFRYLYASCFARVKGYSPRLTDYPKSLLPAHSNIEREKKTQKFNDRFRVQVESEPSKTITSHISKDGHYYIHPDPAQCRSFTVREAARIQTFPDNYYFCGPRTFQFVQVGNAVPPLLANRIAEVVYKLFTTYFGER